MKTGSFLIIFTILSLISCATVKTREEKHKEIEVISKRTGITGVLIPVDKDGREIIYQEKEKIIVNLIPIKDGHKLFEQSLVINPESNGSFKYNLNQGEYFVEIFLKGFFVNNFEITIPEDEFVDLGVIKLKKIEADSGEPLKGEDSEEVILNEGDVNIEPPSF